MPCHPSDSNQFGLDWSRQYFVYIKDRFRRLQHSYGPCNTTPLNQSKMVKVHAFTSVQYDISLNDDEWPGERTGSICVKFSWWGPTRRLDWFVGLQNRSLAHTTVCCDSVVCLCPWFASYCALDKSMILVKSAENDLHSCIRSFILGTVVHTRLMKFLRLDVRSGLLQSPVERTILKWRYTIDGYCSNGLQSWNGRIAHRTKRNILMLFS